MSFEQDLQMELLVDNCKTEKQAIHSIGKICIANMSLKRPLDLTDITYSSKEGFRWGKEWNQKEQLLKVQELKEKQFTKKELKWLLFLLSNGLDGSFQGNKKDRKICDNLIKKLELFGVEE